MIFKDQRSSQCLGLKLLLLGQPLSWPSPLLPLGLPPSLASLSSSKQSLERHFQLDMLLLLLLLWGIKGVEGAADALKGFTLNVERKVVVQEGLCVLVPCNFSYPKFWHTDSSPVYGYWFRKKANTDTDAPVATNNPKRPAQKRTQHRFFLPGDQQKNDCSLNIREVEKKDAGTYFFRLERGITKFNYLWNMMTLDVTGQT